MERQGTDTSTVLSRQCVPITLNREIGEEECAKITATVFLCVETGRGLRQKVYKAFLWGSLKYVLGSTLNDKHMHCQTYRIASADF